MTKQPPANMAVGKEKEVTPKPYPPLACWWI